MPRTKIKVCGVPVLAYNEQTYGGGHIAPTARNIGRFAHVSKATAKKLLKTLFGHEKLPRAGYEMKLCDNQYLGHRRNAFDASLPYEVVRRASGEFAGTTKRKRKR